MIDRLIFLTLLLLSYAATAEEKTKLPRFATIKTNEVNARQGPSTKSNIEWVFIKKGEPVEITAEYEHWRQIRDIKGEGGWVHVSALSIKRAVIINTEQSESLRKDAANDSALVAKLAPELRCTLKKCAHNWCNIECIGYRGWVPHSSLWGVYASEALR